MNYDEAKEQLAVGAKLRRARWAADVHVKQSPAGQLFSSVNGELTAWLPALHDAVAEDWHCIYDEADALAHCEQGDSGTPVAGGEWVDSYAPV